MGKGSVVTWFLVALACHSATALFTPTLFFNYTVSGASPMLRFRPDKQTNLVFASNNSTQVVPPWNTSFSGIPSDNYAPSQAGVGAARSSISTLSNRTGVLSIYYWGTGLYWSGEFSFDTGPSGGLILASRTDMLNSSAVPGRARITVNSTTPTKAFSMMGNGGLPAVASRQGNIAPESDFYQSYQNDPNALYTLAIDSVTIETGIRVNATKFEDVNSRVERIITADGKWNEFFPPRAETTTWNISSELDGVAGQPTPPYAGQRTIVTSSLADKLYANIPRGTAFIVINGTTGPTKGQALVQVAAEAPAKGMALEVVLTNPWVSLETIFMAPLDPERQYNVTISPILGPDTGTLTTNTYPNGVGLHSITLYSGGDLPPDPANKADDDSTPSSKPQVKGTKSANVGAIAGGVVATVVVLLVAAALFFLKRGRNRITKDKFNIDDAPSAYKDVDDEGGYADAALTAAVPTDPLLSGPDTRAQSAPARQDAPPRRPRVMHALDMEDVPLHPETVGGPGNNNILPASINVAPPASGTRLVAMPQHQLDSLLGLGRGGRTGKDANTIVQVPQSKVDLLNRGLAPPPHRRDTVVSVPKHELDGLLGIAGPVHSAHAVDDNGTAVSMPQYKLDALLANTQPQRPPTYHD